MFRVIVPDPSSNAFLLGTFDGKLFSVTPEGARRIPYPHNPEGHYFENYCAVAARSVYLPTAGRVLRVKGNRAEWLSLPMQEYRSIAAMPDGNLIAGWEGSFPIFSPEGTLIRTLDMDELLQFCHSRPCFDAQGNLYLGGVKGITRYGGSCSVLLTHPEMKSCRVLRSDGEGNIWAASQHRLFTLKGGQLHKFKELEGEVTNLFFTEKGKMVVGTTKNLYLFSDDRQYFVIYNQHNGYTLSEPVRCDMYEDGEGNVWMPAVEGLACFNPERLMGEQPVPLLHLLRLESSTDNIHWEHTLASNIRLQHRYNNIRFHFIGLSYSQVQNVRYRYRLTGFQNEWSQPVAEREVTFNNLPPGHYTFQLKADAGAAGTETATLSLPLYIRPAFWQKWLFKTALFVLCAGMIGLFLFRYLKMRHEREVRRINRQKEMNELRIQSVRLKSIPHFNSNVLAGIEYFILTKSKEEANELLSTYSRFTNITLHDIDKAQRSLKEELSYVRMYLELEKMRYGDKLTYQFDIAADIAQEIAVPNMVLHTFTENAVKHGICDKKSAGRVVIRAVAEKKGVRLSVEDNGVGRTVSEEKNMVLGRQGHGLSILTRQIDLYNQQNDEKIEEKIVDLKDANGNAVGTRFELYVPYAYKYV